MSEVQIIKRPDWWEEGLPLPHLSAGDTYTGNGALNSGGKVTVTRQPVRWETLAEWKARKATTP